MFYLFLVEYLLTFDCDNQNLPTKSRPQEVSEWIKSKKKYVVPLIKPSTYGTRFMEWWVGMQPSWRASQGSKGLLDLTCETPKAETWQVLNKGGTAGIYVVVMGLSWWIKGQQNKCDANAWAAVDDVSWVIQQMTDGVGSHTLAIQKRRREDEGEDKVDEAQPKRKYGYVIFIVTIFHLSLILVF